MITRLLVANRGEIACRIFRTCRRLGIHTLAVYSDADATARHVREADRAVRIGPAPARASYLDVNAVVRAAAEHGAEAVHPGYGFLSEKPELAAACLAAGLVWVGPHPEAIARMGSKIEAKRIARAAGIACVPGYDGDDQSAPVLLREAERLGMPLLIKASAGGGGKGMKRVDRLEDFPAQLALARAEARAAFGDERVMLERCIVRPRHLEVQLMGDRRGGLVHFFERECSIQRNYQKLIEEAPARHLDERVRQRLFDAALALGRAIGYDSAGTVEFVLDADRGDEPYFLEMNTRLQVEHPVTELTTGVDLVELQIMSACGEPLPLRQEDIRRRGAAIEARVNAEVPEEAYRASFGPVRGYEEPVLPGVRVDSGIDGTSEITPHYDSMVAKVIAYGATRPAARDRLREGIAALRIEGIQTNQRLLADIIDLPAFDAVLTTRLLAEAWPGGWQPAAAQGGAVPGLAAAAWCFEHVEPESSDLPLDTLVGWRLSAPAGRGARLSLCVSELGLPDVHAVEITMLDASHVVWRCAGAEGLVTRGACDAGVRLLHSSGRTWRACRDEDMIGLWSEGTWRSWRVEPLLRARSDGTGGHAAANRVEAGLPGVVSQLLVARGQAVRAGEPVAVLEAMKLFHTLCAPCDGTVAKLAVAVGQTVPLGAVLIEFDRADDRP